jgi:hypothetical protein
VLDVYTQFKQEVLICQGQDSLSTTLSKFLQSFQKIKAIALVPEDVASLYSPNHHMMQSSGSV